MFPRACTCFNLLGDEYLFHHMKYSIPEMLDNWAAACQAENCGDFPQNFVFEPTARNKHHIHFENRLALHTGVLS